MLGLDKLWNMLDGMKCYLTGAATMLTGIAGLINEWLNATSGHDIKALIAFLQACPKDSNWIMILAGFGVIAAAHKADKIIAATNTPNPVKNDSAVISLLVAAPAPVEPPKP